jgi:hypothetical protein
MIETKDADLISYLYYRGLEVKKVDRAEGSGRKPETWVEFFDHPEYEEILRDYYSSEWKLISDIKKQIIIPKLRQ